MSAAGRPPERHEQTMAALSGANRVRLAQTALKREVCTGSASVAEALTDDRVASRTTVIDLLTWQHRWGRTRARRLIGRTAVPEGKPVRQLTARQRAAIVAAIDHDAETLTGVGSAV